MHLLFQLIKIVSRSITDLNERYKKIYLRMNLTRLLVKLKQCRDGTELTRVVDHVIMLLFEFTLKRLLEMLLI
jgi:hypothetical protein